MATVNFPLVCHWGGELMEDPGGVHYRNGQRRVVVINCNSTFTDIVNKLYQTTGFDPKVVQLKIKMKYPVPGSFIALPLDDDEALLGMWTGIAQITAPSMEIYLEQIQVLPSSVCTSPTMPTESSIQLDDQQTQSSGPLDCSVLNLQEEHRSEDVWQGKEVLIERCREHLSSLADLEVDERILNYVRLAGFYGVHRLVCKLPLDRPLITALVERWRQETHTFHLPVGEATITLQDVAVLVGLRVHGFAVTGTSGRSWPDEVERLLGVRPQMKQDIQGSSLRMTWIRQHFSVLPADADNVTIQQHARAYILQLMGSSLFADKSGNEVQLLYLPLLDDLDTAGQYSWGSATLAFLYRQLCRASRRGTAEIGGFLLLLQLWSWEHIHIGRPTVALPRHQPEQPQPDHPAQQAQTLLPPLGPDHLHGIDPLGRRWLFVELSRVESATGLGYYRYALDGQSPDEMTWQPYTPDILEALPDVCKADQHIWRTKVPLICFDIVEMHLPDRVLRQFGLQQPVPIHCDTRVDLHKIDRRGKPSEDWSAKHRVYASMWTKRSEFVVSGNPATGSGVTPDYMTWYRQITRLFISPSFRADYQPTSASFHLATRALQQIHAKGIPMLNQPRDAQLNNQSLLDIVTLCADVLRRVGEGHLLDGPAAGALTLASSSSSSGPHAKVVRTPRAPRRRVRARTASQAPPPPSPSPPPHPSLSPTPE